VVVGLVGVGMGRDDGWVVGVCGLVMSDGWCCYCGVVVRWLGWWFRWQNRGVSGSRTRGFVWASKREAEKWHTETRSNLADFCLARVRGVVREGLV